MSTQINPFSFLKQQVRSCLEREAKLSVFERRQFQWQFYTTVNEVVYIVGKGGANTMFYMIGVNGERKLCLPEEMLSIIGSWGGQKFSSYIICKSPKHVDFGPFTSIDSAKKQKKVKIGSYLIGVAPDGKKKRLLKLERGLTGKQWVEFNKH